MTRLKAKSKVKLIEITQRTTRSVTTELYKSCSKIPKVPNEIYLSILNTLKTDGDFKTLTSVARTNHAMYDMVIPRIYETVVFNHKNSAGKGRRMIGRGHRSQHNHKGKPTRKDIATSFTRTIILDDIPDLPISHAYRAFNELVIGYLPMYDPWPYCWTFDEARLWVESCFEKCLDTVDPSFGSRSSLHVKLCIKNSVIDDTDERLGALFHCFETAIRCTYEITDVGHNDGMTIYMAYDLQCVVHLNGERSWEATPEGKAKRFASHIDQCFDEEDLDTPTGQLFICDLPSIVLTPQELASADVDETAINKICDLVSIYPDLTGSIYKTKLDFFRSRIKLVKSGFKPSLADLYPRPQPKRGLSAVMLPDDFVYVPDEPWSLTDDDPMDSEAEYSGSETSGYDSGSDSEVDE